MKIPIFGSKSKWRMTQSSKVALRNWTTIYNAQSTECTPAPTTFLFPSLGHKRKASKKHQGLYACKVNISIGTCNCNRWKQAMNLPFHAYVSLQFAHVPAVADSQPFTFFTNLLPSLQPINYFSIHMLKYFLWLNL